MKKKVYIKIIPKRPKNLDHLLDQTLDQIKTVENVEKVEGQVGLTGDVKRK